MTAHLITRTQIAAGHCTGINTDLTRVRTLGNSVDRFLQHDCDCCDAVPASIRLHPWRKRRTSPELMRFHPLPRADGENRNSWRVRGTLLTHGSCLEAGQCQARTDARPGFSPCIAPRDSGSVRRGWSDAAPCPEMRPWRLSGAMAHTSTVCGVRRTNGAFRAGMRPARAY